MEINNNMPKTGFNGAIKLPAKNLRAKNAATGIVARWGGDLAGHLKAITDGREINIHFLNPNAETSAIEYLKNANITNYVHQVNPNLTAEEFSKFCDAKIYA